VWSDDVDVEEINFRVEGVVRVTPKKALQG
jgi:hypothetical protein